MGLSFLGKCYIPTTGIVKVSLAVHDSIEVFGKVHFDKDSLVQVALDIDHIDQGSVLPRMDLPTPGDSPSGSRTHIGNGIESLSKMDSW